MQTSVPPVNVNFGAFKDTFSNKMNFIKRRFSSSDLQDGEEEEGQMASSSTAARDQRPDCVPYSQPTHSTRTSSTISAPTSPSKSHQPIPMGTQQQQSMSQSMYSQVQGITRNLFQAATGQKPAQTSYNKDRCKCLLVIDDQHTDWSKYFRNKKVLNDWDVRVEQAEYSELSLASYSDPQLGCMVSMQVNKGGSLVVRQFRPDFVLFRQPVHSGKNDWRPLLIGLLFGGVPGCNSVHSVYHFHDKPWVMIQRKLGRDKFPLIDQAFYPNHTELASQQSRFPVVVKVGHGHAGLGKIKASNAAELQDIASVVALTSEYCTLEPFVDSKYDIHIQKVGGNYKAFMRKSITGYWKANTGSAMLEQIAMTDRYKQWIDEVAQLFGGLDISSLQALVGKDGKEFIFEANDSSFQLIGETQEEDRRQIAELTLAKMNHILGLRHALSRRESAGSASLQNFIKHESPYHQAPPTPPVAATAAASPSPQPAPTSAAGATTAPTAVSAAGRTTTYVNVPPSRVPSAAPPSQATAVNAAAASVRPSPANPFAASNQTSTVARVQSPPSAVGAPPPQPPRAPPPRPTRQPSLTSQSSKDLGMERNTASSTPQRQDSISAQVDDTMSNLKKTFAGIFGDM